MSDDLQKFQYLVSSALLSIDDFQQQSQSKLLSFRAENPQQFIYLCSLITTDENKKDDIRLAAGTLMSAAIIIKSQDKKQSMWNSVNPQIKETIRTTLLDTLVSRSQVAKKAAASSIAAIASIELPLGQWDKLLEILLNIINGENVQQLKTAVMTLGFINSQFVKEEIIPSQHHSQMILAGILIGLQKAEANPEVKSKIKYTLLNSLRESMSFVSKLLQNPQAKQHLIKAIFIGLSDHETTQPALQALEELCKHAYFAIKQHVTHFHQSLYEILNRNNDQSIAAIEIWNIMGQHYLQRKSKFQDKDNPNYLSQIADSLFDVLIAQIVKETNPQQLIDVASATLDTLLAVSNFKIYNKITQFVSKAMKNENYHIRKATVFVFSSLVETTQPLDTVLSYFDRGFFSFLEILNDQNSEVIKYSLKGWAKIFNRPQLRAAFLEKDNCQFNINQIVKHALSYQQSNQIQYSAINVVFCLFEDQHIIMKQQKQNFTFNLLKALTVYCFETKQLHLQTVGFCCILNVLVASQHTTINSFYVQHLIDKVVQNNITSLNTIHCVMDVISVGIKKSRSMNSQLNNMTRAFDFVVNHMTKYQQIDKSCIDIFASLVYCYRRTFEEYCKDSQKYLFAGLVSYEDVKLCQASLGYLSDIALNLPAYLKRNFQRYMDLLMKALNSDIYRQLKIKVLDAVGDCIIAGGILANPYIPGIIDTIRLCYSVASEPSQDEYFDHLKSSLMKLENSLVVIFGEQGLQNKMYKQHFEMTIKFVLLTTNQEFNPQVSYFQEGIQIIFCGAQQFGYMHLIDTKEFDEKLKVLMKYACSQNWSIQTLMAIKQAIEQYRSQIKQ